MTMSKLMDIQEEVWQDLGAIDKIGGNTAILGSVLNSYNQMAPINTSAISNYNSIVNSDMNNAYVAQDLNSLMTEANSRNYLNPISASQIGKKSAGQIAGGIGLGMASGAAAGMALGPIGAAAGAIGGGLASATGAILNNIKANNITNDLNKKFKMANSINDFNLLNQSNVINKNNYNNIWANSKASGGSLDNGVTIFETGGTHEQNPFGGIPIGVDANGTPNLVEEGEVKFNNYIYSNRLKADEDILKSSSLPNKYKGKSYAQIAKDIQKESEERPNDLISQQGLQSLMNKLQIAQETQKQQEQQMIDIQNQDTFNAFAFGGNLFADGGDIPPKGMKGKPDPNQSLADALWNGLRYIGDDGKIYHNVIVEKNGELAPVNAGIVADVATSGRIGGTIKGANKVIQLGKKMLKGKKGKANGPRIEIGEGRYVPATRPTTQVANTTTSPIPMEVAQRPYLMNQLPGRTPALNGHATSQLPRYGSTKPINMGTSATGRGPIYQGTGQPALNAPNTGMTVYRPTPIGPSHQLPRYGSTQPINMGTSQWGGAPMYQGWGSAGALGTGAVGRAGTFFDKWGRPIIQAGVPLGLGLGIMGGAALYDEYGREVDPTTGEPIVTQPIESPLPLQGNPSVTNPVQPSATPAPVVTNPSKGSGKSAVKGSGKTSTVPVSGGTPVVAQPVTAQPVRGGISSGYTVPSPSNSGFGLGKSFGYDIDTSGTFLDPTGGMEVPTLFSNPQKGSNISQDDFTYNPNTGEFKLKPSSKALRLSPVFGNALAIMSDTFGLTNNPNFSSLDAMDRNIMNVPKVSYTPIGTYQQYTPEDYRYIQNTQASQNAAARRAAMGNNGISTNAQNVALDYNYNNTAGNIAAQQARTNLQNRNAVNAFNASIDAKNAAMGIDALTKNQALALQQAGYLNQNAALREQMKQDAAAARFANFGNMFDNLGLMGQEQMNLDSANWAASRGIFGNGAQTLFPGIYAYNPKRE